MNTVETIRTRIDELAQAITEAHLAAHPETFARYGAIGRVRCLEDARFHLQYLAAALEAESVALFLDYIAWTKIMLARRHVTARDLADNLAITARVLHDLPDALTYMQTAVEQIPSMPDDAPSLLDPRAPLWSESAAYLAGLLRGSRTDALHVVTQALDHGAKLRDVYRHILEPAQQEIGRLWQLNQITVAQEHFCTAATQHIMTQLYTRLFARDDQPKGRVVSMCVGGELHEVGLRIVTDLLELDGWQTWYLGASVPPAAAVQLCVAHRADFLLVSATLPPHLASVTEVVRLFRARKELGDAKVLVGGRAFRNAPHLWRTIGADGYGANADECAALVNAGGN